MKCLNQQKVRQSSPERIQFLNCFQLQDGFDYWPLIRGLAFGPRWRHNFQTPTVGSYYRDGYDWGYSPPNSRVYSSPSLCSNF